MGLKLRKSILLGTGGGECIPALFCDCEVCREARIKKGKYIRTRSDFMIDEENLIDFGPDVYSQCINTDIDLLKLKNIFLTHFHDDHLSVDNLILIQNKVRLYANKKAIDLIKEALPIYKMHGYDYTPDYFKNIEWVAIEPFVTYEIDGIKVTPVLAAHYGYAEKECGYNYIVTNKQNETYIYAADTGWYDETTWNFLKNSGISLDYAIIECCYGTYERPLYDGGHLDFKNLKLMLDRFKEYGLISKKTPIYLTHICHLNTMKPEEISEMFKDYGYTVTAGYDGMEI